jgi:hypothetical protein
VNRHHTRPYSSHRISDTLVLDTKRSADQEDTVATRAGLIHLRRGPYLSAILLLGALTLACSPPTPSAAIRAEARAMADAERSKGNPPLGRVVDPQAPGYWFIFDPDGLIPKAQARGEEPAGQYRLSDGSFSYACRAIEPSWSYCEIS